MAKESVYTIVIETKRVEVSQDVYHAYYRMREKERYQRQLIERYERSLERFQEEGLPVEYQNGICHPATEEEVIRSEERMNLYLALNMLAKEDWLLIEQLFFEQLTEQELAMHLGITQQAVSKRKIKLLERLRLMLEQK